MNLSRRKRAAACLLVINLLEEDEFGERCWKRGRTREWIKRRDERGMLKLVEELRVEDTAAYKEMLRMNCETFEQILTAIGPEITKHQVAGGHRVISPVVISSNSSSVSSITCTFSMISGLSSSISTLFSEEPRDTREQLLADILNEPADFRGKQLTEKLS